MARVMGSDCPETAMDVARFMLCKSMQIQAMLVEVLFLGVAVQEALSTKWQ